MTTKPASSGKAKPKASGKPQKASTTEKRINFPKETVRQIAFEAHLFCSNPECCRFTSYSTTEAKARAIAEAAHINAASEDGPRPGDVRTEEELKSATNGIWLCDTCHRLIDDDPSRFPESRLREWKSNHAEFVRGLVGKEFDIVHFKLYARSKNTAHCISFLTFLENRRVFFNALDAEFPWQVFKSLSDVRYRIEEARAAMMDDTVAMRNIEEMLTLVHEFLTENPRLDELKCDGNDPEFRRFCVELAELRAKLLPLVIAIADDVEYKPSAALITEARRLGVY
ncbi:HNH endonuclease [Paraburkholderia phytofirmans]